jgi:gamma-glutamyl-gamma-aminobutyrate hydrolase PuuD
VTAVARDGVVEGIEAIDDPRVYGVQWHPEGPVSAGDPQFLPLFQYLVDQAIVAHERRAKR